MASFGEVFNAFRWTFWHCVNLVEAGMIFKPNLLRVKNMLLNVPEIGISSHFRIYLLMTGSTFSIIHVFDRDATVKCHDILDRTYRLYKRSLFFGCKGARSISDISSFTSEINSSLCSSLDILKSKYVPRYLKDSPILTVGTGQSLISNFGRYWIDFVKAFLMAKVLHLSTLIIIFDH